MELEVPSYLERVKLNGTNNFGWCRGVELYLTSIGLEHHLTEDTPIGDQRKLHLWTMEESQIVILMRKTMEPHITLMCECAGQKTCKEIWDYVMSMYSRDRTKLYELWVKFIRLKQGSMSVDEYSSAFLALHYELKKALPGTDDVEQMRKQNEMLITFCFLHGLGAEFEPEIYRVLREAELPSRDEIVHRMCVVESFLAA